MYAKIGAPDIGMCTQCTGVLGGVGFNSSCLLQFARENCLKREKVQRMGERGGKGTDICDWYRHKKETTIVGQQ